jgi:hypothetical protein
MSRYKEICGLMSYANRREMSGNKTVTIVIDALLHV